MRHTGAGDDHPGGGDAAGGAGGLGAAGGATPGGRNVQGAMQLQNSYQMEAWLPTVMASGIHLASMFTSRPMDMLKDLKNMLLA